MKCAWVTLLSEPSYLMGVLALRRSLDRAGTRFPLLVMVTSALGSADRETLKEAGCDLREVSPLAPTNTDLGYASPQFTEVWTKLNAWAFTDFDRLVYLDADMLVLRNMDELFDVRLAPKSIAACHACRCNPHHKATYPKSWVPEACFYSHAAGTEFGEAASPSDYFNSGMFILRPDSSAFHALRTRVETLDGTRPMPFAEQDLLNEYFEASWVTLPYIYNALKIFSKCHPGIWDLDSIKNLHFILDKPWRNTVQADGEYAALDQLWWDAYRHS